eukprot:g20075.t1
MTSGNAMEVADNALEPMDDSSTSSSGEEEESGGCGQQEDDNMEGSGSDSEQEEEERGKAANPAFSKFMQGFWDLASVDVPVRVGAAAMIVRHVSSADGGGDAEYAVKRLVRGMCSSREAARQGFGSCLTQVLTVLPKDKPTTPSVLEQILKATQTTAAMKGADERELALGRLLGVSALAMSGRLRSEPESAEGALKAVSELYTRRKWIGQAAGEAALLVASKAFEGQGEFARAVLPLLVPLLKGKDGSTLQVADLTPDQLMLSLGLRSIMRERGLDPQEDAALKQALPPFLRHASVVRVGKTQELLSPLKQSASAFPKVHSVWGRLWDDLGMSMSPPGQRRASLSPKRLKKLGEVWSAVVDGSLTTTSINNKGTAILLLKQVLQRVPAAGVWHVLSPGIVRLMLNHTKGEENYLFSLVRMTLKQLPKIVKDDQEVQAQVAACLLRRGTIRFDNRAGTNVVSSLVRAMGQEALDAHVEFLKGVVQGKPGWADSNDSQPLSNGTSSPATATTAAAAVTADGGEQGDAAGGEGSVAERLQAVEALYSLVRSFGEGGGGEGRRGSKGGNGDARSSAIAAADGGGVEVRGKRLARTAEFFLEVGFFAPEDGAAPLPPKMLELCRSKFFSLVADIAAKPLFWQTGRAAPAQSAAEIAAKCGKSKNKKSPSKKAPSSPSEETAAVAAGGGWGALEALWGLHEAWRGLEGMGRKLVKGVSVGMHEREACSVALAVVGRIRAGDARGDKLGSAFAGILLMVSLHLLEGSKEDDRGEERCQHITDLVETYGRMSGSGTGGDDEADDDDDEEEEDDEDGNNPDPLAVLADVLVAVVAEPSTHSVRGLRDTARRVWGMVCGARPLTRSALDTLLAAVCGEDDANAGEDDAESSEEEEEEEEKEEEEEEEEEKEKEGSSDDEDEEGDEGHTDGKAKAKSKAANGKGDDDSDDGEEDEDEDEVMVDPSDLEALLGGDDDDEDGEGLQHHSAADAALGALLVLKKSGRKKGVLEAQRQGYQIRLRALDLLEAVCSRRPDSPYLLSALVPVLKSIKKVEGAAWVGNRDRGEAAALSMRLQTLYKNRLCKCKPRTRSSPSSHEAADDLDAIPARTAEDFSELMGLCRAWEKDARLASLALEGALCCLRSLKSCPANASGGGAKGDGKGEGGGEALDTALKTLAAAVGDFFGKRRGGGLTAMQVEEMVKRFPGVLWPVLVKAAQGAAARDFLRTESFRLLAGVLQRRSSMDPASRKALLARCPDIVKALGDVLSSAAAETASPAAGAGADATNGDEQAAPRIGAGKAASSTMLKAKRMKPLLACLSAAISAADGGEGTVSRGNGFALFSGPAAASEARALRAALEAVGEASASLAMQQKCGQVAHELDAVAPAGGVGQQAEEAAQEGLQEGDKKKKKKKRKVGEDGEASPKTPKRKAAQVDGGGDGSSGAATPGGVGDAAAGEAEDGKASGKSGGSSSKKKKKRRESKEG